MKQLSLFDSQPAVLSPLASRLRPDSLDDFVGQEHLLGPGKLLRQMIDSDRISSRWTSGMTRWAMRMMRTMNRKLRGEL